jgi:hypothetical protein
MSAKLLIFTSASGGGGITDQAVLDGLARTFLRAAIGLAHASTEAGVGFAVDDGREGLQLAALESAAPTDRHYHLVDLRFFTIDDRIGAERRTFDGVSGARRRKRCAKRVSAGGSGTRARGTASGSMV